MKTNFYTDITTNPSQETKTKTYVQYHFIDTLKKTDIRHITIDTKGVKSNNQHP